MARVAIDLDHTLLTGAPWPGIGKPMPGATEAVKAIQEAGHSVFVYTARTSPFDWNGNEHDPGFVFMQRELTRRTLDEMDLADVPIWDGRGKPMYNLLVDDRAMWFPMRPGSWDKMVPKVLLRLETRDKGR